MKNLLLGTILLSVTTLTFAEEIETRVSNNEVKQLGLAQRVADAEAIISNQESETASLWGTIQSLVTETGNSITSLSEIIQSLTDRVNAIEAGNGSSDAGVSSFVGYTQAKVTGTDLFNPIALNQLCKVEFGNSAHWATSQEFYQAIESGDISTNPIETYTILKSVNLTGDTYVYDQTSGYRSYNGVICLSSAGTWLSCVNTSTAASAACVK
jgi:hypothetical protein